MTKMESGPHINVAVFCDGTVVGEDKALSIIRIIDTVTQQAIGAEPPDEMPPFVVKTKLVVSLKADQARGRYKLKLRPEAPDGRHLPVQEQVVHLEGGHTGVNVIVDVNLGVDLEGVYWFDVLLEVAPGTDRLLTRIPLRVVYQPQRTAGSSNS